jgi:hypothetical protein
MALNDGQLIALITGAGTVIVGTIGYLSSRYGTFSSRQTEIEKNLLEQMKATGLRLDSVEKERSLLETSYRAQLDLAAKERRLIEQEFRSVIDQLEKEIDELKAANELLRQENWLLKNRMIGITEPAPFRAESAQDPDNSP